MKNLKIQNKQANKTPKQLITSFQGAWASCSGRNQANAQMQLCVTEKVSGKTNQAIAHSLLQYSDGYWHEGTFLSEPYRASRTTQDDRYVKLP